MIEQKLGNILGLFIAPPEHKGYPRPARSELLLVADEGIEGDKFRGVDPNKAVLIVGKESYEIASGHGVELERGSLAENILFDFDPHELKIGARIKMDEVEIEVVEKCTTCNHLAVFSKELPHIIKGHRGVYCKINRSGKIDRDSSVVQLICESELYMMDDESKKLYACVTQHPNHFIRLKTVLLIKDIANEEALEAEITRLESAPNLMDALDSYAEYPDFVISGFIKTQDGKIAEMGGVAGEIELTFPSSNGSYLQILSERIKGVLDSEIYLCCAIDMVEVSGEKSELWKNLDAIKADDEVPQNVMMEPLEWEIYQKSLDDGEYESGAWNMGLFVVKKEKQLAKILGYYP